MLPNKYELPFEIHPLSTVFYYTAFPLGIIQAKVAEQEYMPWLSGKYINCLMQLTPGKTKLHISIEDDKWCVKDGILSYQHTELMPTLYSTFGSFAELIKRMLVRNYYVYGFCNEEWIPNKRSYQKSYFAHDYIIIGYNDEEQCFISVGYLSDGQFQKYKMSYSDFEQAMQTLKEPVWKLNFYQLREEAKFNFCLSNVISELEDYLNSTAPTEILHSSCYYGITAIQVMKETISKTMSELSGLDFRITRSLMEHKLLMYKRINFFFEKGYIRNSELVNHALLVYDIAKKIHMLGLKYTYKPMPSVIQSIRTFIDDLLQQEQNYLPLAITELNYHLNSKLYEEEKR